MNALDFAETMEQILGRLTLDELQSIDVECVSIDGSIIRPIRGIRLSEDKPRLILSYEK